MSKFFRYGIATFVGTLLPLASAENVVHSGQETPFGVPIPSVTPAVQAAQSIFQTKPGDGYHEIRVPSIVRGGGGRLLVFAEGRKKPGDEAENDLLMRYSDNGGGTWSVQQVIASPGKASFNNPCPVYDATSGNLFVLFQHYPEGVTERNKKAIAGVDGAQVVGTRVIQSTDNGKTWSTPKDITLETKRPEMKLIAAGPCAGLQVTQGPNSGRLVVPFNEAPEFGQWDLYAVYSDDHGKTWTMGPPAPGCLLGKQSIVNECTMAETAGGGLILNARTWGGGACRKWARSANTGTSWDKIQKSIDLYCDSTQGALLRFSFPRSGKGKSRLLYSGVGGPKRRTNGVIALSYDEGETWAHQKVVVPGPFAYSGLAAVSEKEIGLIYEANRQVFYTTVSLDWLTEGKDKGD